MCLWSIRIDLLTLLESFLTDRHALVLHNAQQGQQPYELEHKRLLQKQRVCFSMNYLLANCLIIRQMLLRRYFAYQICVVVEYVSYFYYASRVSCYFLLYIKINSPKTQRETETHSFSVPAVLKFRNSIIVRLSEADKQIPFVLTGTKGRAKDYCPEARSTLTDNAVLWVERSQ